MIRIVSKIYERLWIPQVFDRLLSWMLSDDLDEPKRVRR